MKWDNLGTYTFNGLGTWTWDTLDNFPNGYEQIFASRETVSANYLTELAKGQGATPHYKVFIEDASGTIDLEFASFERIVTTPEISRSLERLFQETQISSIGLNVDNTDDYFNPMGTGLFNVSSVYNKPIKVWKGFKYGWNGSRWGTAEYIPAFTGYIDNIQQDSQGYAVINARDKGKLFQNNTSEKTTQTGTAGGAYWVNKRIDQLVGTLISQSISTSIDKSIDVTVLNSHDNSKSLSLYSALTPAISLGLDFNNGTWFAGMGTVLFKFTPYKDLVAFGTLTGMASNRVQNLYYNNGTIFTVSSGLIKRTDMNGNTVDITSGTFSQNHEYEVIYDGTSKIFGGIVGGAGTIVLGIYNMADNTMGTYTGVNSGNFQYMIDVDRENNMLYVSNFRNGTSFIHKYNIDNGAGTTVGTISAQISLGCYKTTNDTLILSNGASVNTFVGGVFTSIGTQRSVAMVYTGTKEDLVYYMNDEFTVGAGTVSLYSYNGTTNARLLQVYGTANAGAQNIFYTPEYCNFGTVKSKVSLYCNRQELIKQYSSEYTITVDSFDVGNGDKVSDVLQTLAEASNYVQYIDEGGVYYFRRRDSGTTIDYTFGTNDIVSLNIVEGEGISQSPIINKGIWGTNTGTVSYEDLPSQGTYGLQAYTLNNKWISSSVIADDVLYGLVNDNKNPKVIITVKLNYYPVVKLFDVVGLDYARLCLSGTKPWQVIGLSENNVNTTLTLKEV